jgi:hypothetical protein
MTDKIIPLIYVLALGFMAYRLCNAVFPDTEKLGHQHSALFIILNVTGFLVTAVLPAPYATFIVIAVFSILALTPIDAVRRIAMFAFLVPILPSLGYEVNIGIPLIWLNWSRLLTIVILLPLLVGAFRHKSALHYPTDKYVWAFFLLSAALAFRDTSFTNGLRGITNLSLDLLTPYFVLSRYLRSFEDIRRVLFPLLASLAFTAFVNVFETVRFWHLYEHIILNVTGARVPAIQRLGLLRAAGPFTIPSRSAFALTAGLGLFWALAPHLRKRALIMAMVAVMATGLFFTFSRGNWMGAVVIGMCFMFTANRKQFFRLSAVLLVAGVLLSTLNFMDDVVNVLPFIGAEESEASGTVSYREDLLQTSIRVANETPWFGSSTFHKHPDMNALRQSSGLLDLVNQYVIVLLNYGYTGLIAFLSIFISVFAALRQALKNSVGQPQDQRHLCRALMFTLAGLLVAIASTSALERVGLIIWCLVAISAVAAGLLAPLSGRPQTEAT